MKRRIAGEGKYLRFVIRDGWEYVERVNSSGVVIIVAMTDDQKVLFVEQFRHPVESKVIAFPAGLANDKKEARRESHSEAARRELEEETGYRARSLRRVFTGPVSAGMCKDMVDIYHASGLLKVGAGGGVEDHENITVHEVPLQTVDAWLERQRRKGLLVAPNIYAGLYFLKYGGRAFSRKKGRS